MTHVFDLNPLQVGGISLPEEFPSNDGYLKDMGINLDISKGVVRSILFCTKDGYSGLKAYTGKFRWKDKEFKLGCDSTIDNIKEIFGAPDEEWHDDSEHNCTYKHSGASIEFSWFYTKRGMQMSYISVDDY